MSATLNIKYTLLSSNLDFTVNLVFDKEDFSLQRPEPGGKDWTRLAFYKCSHCPLDEKDYQFCPLAGAIDSVISPLHSLLSYDEVHARVEYQNRTVSADITVQRALSSLLGLIIPASGCPHTRYLRPMSRYHLPFADTEETIYRATTMFLMAQYFIHRKSGCIPTDFSRLGIIYNNLHIVNTQICNRLRVFCENDSPLNAITILDMLTMSMQSALKHDLDKFAPYFSAFSANSLPPQERQQIPGGASNENK